MKSVYCAPGNKADDRLREDLAELGAGARLVTAVSNDRELKASLRAYGASCLGVGEFLALLEGGKKGRPSGKDAKNAKKNRSPLPKSVETDVMRAKTRSLSASEVRAWMEFFGVDGEDDAE